MPIWSKDFADLLAKKAKAMETKAPTCKKCGGTGVSEAAWPIATCQACGGTGVKELAKPSGGGV